MSRNTKGWFICIIFSLLSLFIIGRYDIAITWTAAAIVISTLDDKK